MKARLVILLVSPCITAMIGAFLFIAYPASRDSSRFLLVASFFGLIYFLLNYWIDWKKNHRSM